MERSETFLVTYLGEGVVTLGRAGLFQTGTTAAVGADVAEEARVQGQFKIRRLGDAPPAAAVSVEVKPPAEIARAVPVAEVVPASSAASPADSEPASAAPAEPAFATGSDVGEEESESAGAADESGDDEHGDAGGEMMAASTEGEGAPRRRSRRR